MQKDNFEHICSHNVKSWYHLIKLRLAELPRNQTKMVGVAKNLIHLYMSRGTSVPSKCFPLRRYEVAGKTWNLSVVASQC